MPERHVFSIRMIGYTTDGVSEDGLPVSRKVQYFPDRGIRVCWVSGQPTRVYRAIPGTERNVAGEGCFGNRVQEFEEIDPDSEDPSSWVRRRFGTRDV